MMPHIVHIILVMELFFFAADCITDSSKFIVFIYAYINSIICVILYFVKSFIKKS